MRHQTGASLSESILQSPPTAPHKSKACVILCVCLAKALECTLTCRCPRVLKRSESRRLCRAHEAEANGQVPLIRERVHDADIVREGKATAVLRAEREDPRLGVLALVVQLSNVKGHAVG